VAAVRGGVRGKPYPSPIDPGQLQASPGSAPVTDWRAEPLSQGEFDMALASLRAAAAAWAACCTVLVCAQTPPGDAASDYPN